MNSYKFVFLLIFALAVFLRTFALNQYPPSLNWDEVSLGYNAYSILKTGADEWGFVLPINFRAYGDYKLPLYVYLDIPFIGIFGLNEWGVRMPSVISGIGIVLLIYFILKELTGNIKLALGGMFLASILPWLIILSRIALEANIALFLVTASFYSFLLGLKRAKFLILSALLLGLSLFAYNSSRVVVFPLIVIAVFLFRKKLPDKKKEVLISFLVLLAFALVVLPAALFQDSSARYRWTTLLDEGAIQNINQSRAISNLPDMFKVIVYNKATYFVSEASKNHVSHFNPDFLFINGGSNYQYSIPGKGLVNWVFLPLILLGLVQIANKKNTKYLFILGWLLIAPIPGAITRDAPHSLRALFMVVPLVIIGIFGIELILSKLKSKYTLILMGLSVALCFFQTANFLQEYTGNYRTKYSWSWQYGYKQAADYIKDNYDNYSKIFVSKKYGEPHEFLLFYLQYNPNKYRNDPNLIRYQRSDWFWIDRFDKFYFVNDWEIKEKVNCYFESCLLLTSPGNYPDNANLIESIYFLDGTKVFDVVKL